MKITVLGAGAWGTAIAVHALTLGHETLLWARDADQVAAMSAERRNRYLPEVALPAALSIGADLGAALRHGAAGLTIIATPMAALREMLAACADVPALVWLSKGFEPASGALGHEVAAALGRRQPAAVLSGPSFALEVARGQPTALVAASDDAALRALLVETLHGEALRIYTSADVVGVEVAGALKNVLAIATGMLDGMTGHHPAAPALNARAALITRALAEMTRLGVALGARAETFMGLSGLGDLVLTATGDLSRNRRVGLLLAQGQGLERVLARLGHVAEGVSSARHAMQRARALGVEMPIIEAVDEVLEGRLVPQRALVRLMARRSRDEG